MQKERYDLLAQTSYQESDCLAKLLTFLFGDEFIIMDKKFRKLLRANPKGFIHLDDLIDVPLIKVYFENIGISEDYQKLSFIQESIVNQCHELHFNMGRVRRKTPFDMEKFKKIKPLCIERVYKPDVTIQVVREILQENVVAMNWDVQKMIIDDRIFIYSQSYRTTWQEWKHNSDLPFLLMDYEQSIKEFDLIDRIILRKRKNIGKPIEMARNNFEETERNHFRAQMDEEYTDNRKQDRKNRKGNGKNKQQEFEEIGREPNPDFNQLLIEYIKTQTMGNQ